MNFYECVGLINYIRYNSSKGICHSCDLEFDSTNQLTNHLTLFCHFFNELPEMGEKWLNPKFLLPIFENDPILFNLGNEIDELDDL